jgi:hypothetical protein
MDVVPMETREMVNPLCFLCFVGFLQFVVVVVGDGGGRFWPVMVNFCIICHGQLFPNF